jgi:arylsulfatase
MRRRTILAAAAVLAAGALLGWLTASCRLSILLAQDKKPDPTPTGGTPSGLPRPDFHFPGNIGHTFLDSDKAQFPQPVQPPKNAPNIVLILLDDAGFGQFSTFGGGVPSPTMDRLAAEGLRYNRFHTTALCSPTRAALITGRNHQSCAFGSIAEAATGYDGYTCVLPRSCGTVGEVLRQNGYMTAWIGKNHNTPTWESSAAGPFDRWANGLGFDYFYGFNAGDMNHWNPVLYENRNLVLASTDPNYHLTEDLADKSIAWVRKVKSISADRPFFLYVAPGATHSPHHAPKEWIDKFRVSSIGLAFLAFLGLDQNHLLAVVITEHADQPIVKATDLEHGHESVAVAQTLAGEFLEEGVDLVRLCGHLPSQQDITVIIAERDGDLPCMLVDSQIEHHGGSPVGRWVKGLDTLP